MSYFIFKEDYEKAKEIGKRIVDCLNYSLFNATPNKNKKCHIYTALKEHGYSNKNYNDVFNQIDNFYSKRSPSNQSRLCKEIFRVDMNTDLLQSFAMEYHQANVSTQVIKQVSSNVYGLMSKLIPDADTVGFKESDIYNSLVSLYKLPHYDKARSFEFWRFNSALMKEVRKTNGDASCAEIERIVDGINPSIDIPSTALPKDKTSQAGEKNGSEKASAKESGESTINPTFDKITLQSQISLSRKDTSLSQSEYDFMKEVIVAGAENVIAPFPRIKGTLHSELVSIHKRKTYHPEFKKILDSTTAYNSYLARHPHDKINQEDNKKLRLTISMAAKKMLTAYDEGKGISVIHGRAPVKLD